MLKGKKMDSHFETLYEQWINETNVNNICIPIEKSLINVNDYGDYFLNIIDMDDNEAINLLSVFNHKEFMFDIDHIDETIWLLIFKYLNLSDLMLVSQVSKKWNYISGNSRLWNNMFQEHDTKKKCLQYINGYLDQWNKICNHLGVGTLSELYMHTQNTLKMKSTNGEINQIFRLACQYQASDILADCIRYGYQLSFDDLRGLINSRTIHLGTFMILIEHYHLSTMQRSILLDSTSMSKSPNVVDLFRIIPAFRAPVTKTHLMNQIFCGNLIGIRYLITKFSEDIMDIVLQMLNLNFQFITPKIFELCIDSYLTRAEINEHMTEKLVKAIFNSTATDTANMEKYFVSLRKRNINIPAKILGWYLPKTLINRKKQYAKILKDSVSVIKVFLKYMDTNIIEANEMVIASMMLSGLNHSILTLIEKFGGRLPIYQVTIMLIEEYISQSLKIPLEKIHGSSCRNILGYIKKYEGTTFLYQKWVKNLETQMKQKHASDRTTCEAISTIVNYIITIAKTY